MVNCARTNYFISDRLRSFLEFVTHLLSDMNYEFRSGENNSNLISKVPASGLPQFSYIVQVYVGNRIHNSTTL